MTNLRVPLKRSDGRAQWQNPCDTKRLLSLLVIRASPLTSRPRAGSCDGHWPARGRSKTSRRSQSLTAYPRRWPEAVTEIVTGIRANSLSRPGPNRPAVLSQSSRQTCNAPTRQQPVPMIQISSERKEIVFSLLGTFLKLRKCIRPESSMVYRAQLCIQIVQYVT